MTMERLRVLMYSERTDEENSIYWILRNNYNDIYFAPNFDIAKGWLLTISFQLILIDNGCEEHFEEIVGILCRRHVVAQIMVIPLSVDAFLKGSREIRAPSPDETTASAGDWYEKDGILHVGRMVIDTNLRKVSYDNKPIRLTRIQFDLLYCLARHKNKVLSYEQLMDDVWKYASLDTTVIKTTVSRLRKKLSDVTGRNHIINENGYGYRFSK